MIAIALNVVLCGCNIFMGDFKVITYKKKRTRKRNLDSGCHNTGSDFEPVVSSNFSKENILLRINSAKDEIKTSEFFTIFYQDLIRDNGNLQNIDIVTYGLGKFSECVSSRYQFAFILVLKDLCEANLLAYDPVFSAEELELIKLFGGFLIENNEEGKREVGRRTLFFLPHCPKQLLNNLLWKNWTSSLKNCIIVGNSIKNIVDAHPDSFLKQNLTYVFNASSYVTEIKINNCFKYSDIFNDLSIHLFPEQSDINTLSSLNKEPQYKEEDIEFITSTLETNLSIKD